MVRLCAVLWVLAFGVAAAQPPRFRYSLSDQALPDSVRRQIESQQLRNDSLNHCPHRVDTLWAGDPAAPIPPQWLKASVRQGCAYTWLPLIVRRRLRDDTASLTYFAAVLRREVPADEASRAWALRFLSWSAEPRFYRSLVAAAEEGVPGVLPDGDFNVPYRAVLELAPYVADSASARRVVWRAATNANATYARQAGILALAAANDGWSRRALRRLPLEKLDAYTRGIVDRALAHAPCARGTIFVQWFGIEGQDFSKCELPPDYR
jgi:hypothetical protein